MALPGSSDIDLVPMNSEDDDLPLSQDDLDLLRSRAFNSELKGLVERVVFDHGREESSPVETARIIEAAEEHDSKDLIRDIHDLFYKTINLHRRSEISVGFDPFSNLQGDVNSSAETYMRNILSDHGIQNSLILAYSYKDKCFIPFFRQDTRENSENWVIAPDEPLFSMIEDTPEGLFIDDTLINAMPYLTKRFKTKNKTDIYYVRSLNFVFENDYEIFNRLQSYVPARLKPIMAVKADEDTETLRSTVMRLQSGILHLPLNILSIAYSTVKIPSDMKNPIYLCDGIGTYARIYGNQKGARCLFLKYTASFTNISYVLMNYLENKLRSLAGRNSAVLHFEKNKFLVYTSVEDFESVSGFLAELSRLFPGDFSIREFDGFIGLELFEVMKS